MSSKTGHAGGLEFSLAEAARDTAPVKGLTHGHYRYPARFSPTFARAAIETFTSPGDWVIDPFAGGGTSLVEALALGRNVLGIDISSLSAFVCEAKTQVLKDTEIAALQRWTAKLEGTINMHAPSVRDERYADAGYYRNLDGPAYWRLRKVIEQALSSVNRLRLPGAQTLARCVVLRTAQWALDARKRKPSVAEFKAQLERQAELMLAGVLEFRGHIERLKLSSPPQARIVNRTTVGAEDDGRVQQACPPKLIVTSPPYPGIHVLYHRWQVDGRREAPAPFWIAGKLDGAGSSYYTMGDRKNPGLESYFKNVKAAFGSIAAMADQNTTIVQMLAFSDQERQFPRYLEIMEECGLREQLLSDVQYDGGRVWRDVPGRRWHAQQKSRAPGAREVVLIHRKA